MDANLTEWNYGEYEGLTTAEIQLRRPEWSLFRDGCPGGEDPAQVAARADRVIGRIRQIEGHAALFAHGHILRVLAARWISLSVAYAEHFLLDTASLSVLSYYYDTPAVKTWNAPIDR